MSPQSKAGRAVFRLECGGMTAARGASSATLHARWGGAGVPAVPEMTFRLWRDDWAKLYINGIFVHADDEGRIAEWQPPYEGVIIPAAYLQTGPNVVAVEVHQANISSSDLVFDFTLFYTNAPQPPEPGVAISNPTNDTIVRIGSSLNIEAIVTAMSNLTQVRFYEDDVLIGTDNDSPYGIVWSNVPGGDHLLIAIAVSPSDTAMSDPVRVTAVAIFRLTFRSPALPITRLFTQATL